ncbi:helix-turn-helix transcriptional regulator [Chitinophaga sp.]|uniref:helix-turn-helix transcriptional regulator n=1 Tax=Chitinophaga sp. TaxID=1869181 RepID=UPI0031D74C21
MELYPLNEAYDTRASGNEVYLAGRFGRICLVQEQAGKTALSTVRVHIKTAVSLGWRQPEAAVQLRYWLKGGLSGKEGFYELAYQPAGITELVVQPGEYEVLCVTPPLHTLEQLALQHTCIRETLQLLQAGHPLETRQYASRIDYRVKSLLHDVLRSDLAGTERELFLGARVIDMLLQYVNYISTYSMDFSTRYHFSPLDVESVYQAREMQEQLLHEPVSGHDLAKTVNLHPRKLAAGFRLLFGTKIRECMLTARMEKAALMLKDPSKTIREIAAETGFNHFSSFSRAFRRHFGCSAFEFRK